MRATFAINSTARRISIGSRLALLACTKYYALSAAANLLEQFVITEIHQKRHRTAGVTAPGYRFVGAETRVQQTGTAGLLRRIRWKRPFSCRTDWKSFRSKISAKNPWVRSFASSGLVPSRLT